MTPEEQEIADQVYEAMQLASRNSERSEQSKRWQAGLSDLGWCAEKTRRMLNQEVPEGEDYFKAFLGTAIGDHVEKALVEQMWPHAIVQASVTATIPGDGGRTYVLPGHPDVVLPEGKVLDNKTVFGLAGVERDGPSRSQQFQRHGYGLGAFTSGLFDEGVTLDDVQVGNIWIDRSGQDQRVHVQMERYNPDVIAEAGAWLDSVIYAYLRGEEALKEPPRDMCAKVCGFFESCRLYDTDVEGLITDQTVLNAVEMYLEGQSLHREGGRLKSMAREYMSGFSGIAKVSDETKWMLRWVHVNAVEVRPHVKAPYEKIDLRKVR